jgi:triacylglycerol esterase/lipase EstA (alpha/beta hydrolase family)
MYAERMGELQRLGLDARIVQVPIDGNVLLNATIISTLIQDLHQQFPDKKFVLVGYSKGGVDITAALSIMPQIAVHVRCVITMFSPLFGSHIASDLNASGPRRYIVSVCTSCSVIQRRFYFNCLK